MDLLRWRIVRLRRCSAGSNIRCWYSARQGPGDGKILEGSTSPWQHGRTGWPSALRPSDRELEPVGVFGGEAVRVPVVPRLFDDGATDRPQARGDRVHVLRRVAPDAKSHALEAVAALAEVVLGETELAAPRLEHDAPEPAALLPPLGDGEAQPLLVPGET